MTVMGGLTKIGGYITIFGLLKIALFLYNRHSFETKLLKKYKQKIQGTLDDDDDRKIDKNTIRELMSYEMLMQLVLAYLRDKKDFRMSTLGLESEGGHSQHSIQRKDTVDGAADDIEEYPKNINKTKSILPSREQEEEEEKENESKKSKKKNKHFIDIHDSDEEDRIFLEIRKSQKLQSRKNRRESAATSSLK